MEHREYESLANREEFYFWHVGRRELLSALLKRYLPRPSGNRIADIGCGTGGDMLFLRPFGKVSGIDSSSEALRLSASKGFTELFQGSAEHLPLPDHAYDLVVTLDVLEHVDDDGAAISEVFRTLVPGGLILVTVPAFQWLWSQHDRALHHRRRYLKSELCRKLREGGFEVRMVSYFVVLGAVMNGLRKCRDLVLGRGGENPRVYDVVFPPPINTALLFVLRLEHVFMRLFSLPFGSSIVAVAQKPSHHDA